jgi:putative membrane protein
MPAQAPFQVALLRQVGHKKAVSFILGISAAMLALLILVIYGHGRFEGAPAWISKLPAINALLNLTSAIFLVLAYQAVRQRDFAAHARRMLCALAASALFLVSYIVYHSVHGDTKFGGHGAVRPVYFFVLITHVSLSAVVLPFIFSSLFFSLSGRFPVHKMVSRYTLPIWLYVSITGVLVFLLLRVYSGS